MLPKSVTPRFVRFTSMAMAILLFFPFILLEYALIKLLAHRKNQPAGALCSSVFAMSYFGVREGLSYLGIEVRSLSVERFQAARCDDQGAVGDLPIQVRHGQWIISGLSALIIFTGLVLTILTWFRTPFSLTDTLNALAAAIVGLLVSRFQPATIAEIGDEGIRAPDSLSGRQTFVPWEELVRFVVIHDDEDEIHGDFELWDRPGRRRFKASSWISSVSSTERDRIFRALRARFTRVEKPIESAWSEPAGAASSAVWDRELDG